jgi:peroxiredoxin Q/BCP
MSDLLQHIVVLGISADSVASHQQFAQKYHLNYPILADPDKKMHIAYGTNGLVSNKRVSFLITPDGIIAKIYDKVNVNTHANDILQAVKHLYNETRNEKAH